MDPQSVSFQPQNDFWRLSSTMRGFQEVQQEHSDRLGRLERRHDEDARLKSVWGASSPFPGVLSSTTSHGPVGQPANPEFANFDEDSSHTLRSLQLDGEEEPRRYGVGSRTNSVRFDDSANQGQWAHASRSSMDLLPRAPSGLGGLGGLPMFERSTSHKSDGRHSSAGQSAVSGRANSLGLDTTHLLAQSPMDPPGLAPGLFILGSVPSIIRCWLNTNFKHDSLLYAAVCTGSYKSYLHADLISKLGFSSRIRRSSNGEQKLKVPVYLPEAVPHYSSSRSSSPAPQLPTLTVEFTVIPRSEEQSASKAIQIFLGSDTLRAHNADILFSTNSMTMFDDERCKLSIPLVRPENDQTFKTLAITSAPVVPESTAESPKVEALAGLGQAPIAPPPVEPVEEKAAADASEEVIEKSAPDTTDTSAVEEGSSAPSRRTSSPAIWGNWRRDSSGPPGSTQGDWANVSRNASSAYQRPTREQGIKVLKPTRQSSRSSTTMFSPSPVTGQSRFFDDGKRRNGTGEPGEPAQPLKRSGSGDSNKPVAKDTPSGSKSRSVNPIGGASAFGWLNSASSQQK